MILIDFAHLTKRCVFTSIANAKAKKKNGKFITSHYSGMLLHGIISSLLYVVKEFQKDYGDLVVCLEGKSWRKHIYPDYKAQRVKEKEASEVVWEEIYEYVNELSGALKDDFGVMVLEHPEAEGDDIIGTLATHTREKTLIVSSDKDFFQLLKNPLVDMFDPIKKEFVPRLSLQEIDDALLSHIIRGDSSDNISNIVAKEKFSPEFLSYLQSKEIFVTTPQEFFKLSISDKLIQEYNVYETYQSGKNKGKEKDTKLIYNKTILTRSRLRTLMEDIRNNREIGEWLQTQYNLNKTLIDLTCIPTRIKDEIITLYANYSFKKPNAMNMLNFCLKHKLNNIVKQLQYFHSRAKVKENSLSDF